MTTNLMTDYLKMSTTEINAIPDSEIRELEYGIRNWECERGTEFDRPETYATLRTLKTRLNDLPKIQAQPVEMAPIVRCNCGHTSRHPMSTARGTACANCYDRMSD